MTDIPTLPKPSYLFPSAAELGVPPPPQSVGDLSRIEVYAPRNEEERQAIKAMLAERKAARANADAEAEVLG